MNESDFQQRADRLEAFVQSINKPKNAKGTPRVRFIVSPSLEDNYKSHSEFKLISQRLAKYLSDDVLQKVEFLRTPSPSTSEGDGVNTGKNRLHLVGEPASDGTAPKRSIVLKHEIHALPSNPKVSAYDFRSIDGFFVRADFHSIGSPAVDENEDTSRATDNGDPDQNDLEHKPPLSEYLTQVKKGDYIWRPWMNLFQRVLETSSQPEKDVAYYETDKSKAGDTQSRSDDGTLFNELEANVLRKFLKIQRKEAAGKSRAEVPDSLPETRDHGSPAPETPVPVVVTPPANLPPIVSTFGRTTRPGRATNLHVSEHFSDPEGNRLTIDKIHQPSHGRVIRDPDHAGRLIYTSDPQFVGVDTFTYVVVDDKGAQTVGTVVMTVANQAPIAVTLERTTQTGKSTNLNVGRFYSDPDNDSLSIERIQQPRHGRVIRDPDHAGRLIFESNRGFTGIDEFKYLIADEFGSAVWAVVRMTVTR
jgi:hypothetical protein